MNRLCLVIALLWLAGCQSTSIKPMQGHADTLSLAPEERRLWHSAEELDQQLRKADSLHEDAELQAYLQAIMQKWTNGASLSRKKTYLFQSRQKALKRDAHNSV